ncbi:TetR family transcriptional regulator [Rhodococcus sp. 1R11]|uniref:TetR/AcrR family transcriptional regulator C-terminal domain-containing protein n=1 Tax=Rhodococcus sp. 1R11 TaxID=2559614 RepID=UPI0010728EC2|nr:TetR/AcrR family transcriptional regulator C-terminal domain-containing protein [Rhodococcus sp. 1R11]TFI44490.1 TetR family transcriptional regulator [Rhodococcus sp. 1R11]
MTALKHTLSVLGTGGRKKVSTCKAVRTLTTVREETTIARPPRAILSRDIIAHTALALVDRHGAEGASMRGVAQKLGVNPTSLYNHVADRAAMIEDVRALVSARIDSAPLREMPWEEGLVAWARSYRSAFAKHHRAVPLLMTTRASTPVLLAEYEDFAVAAEAVGWATRDVLPLLTAFESFILGSVLDMSGPKVVFDPTDQEEDFPRLAAAYETVSDEQDDDPIATRAFEMGLEMLVASSRPWR